MNRVKVWYAVTGDANGHGAVITVGQSFADVLDELKLTAPLEVVDKLAENDQNYISIQYAVLLFSVPERR